MMTEKIFTQADYDKFFYNQGEGDTLKHHYLVYFRRAVEIAPESNGDGVRDWSCYFPEYFEFEEEWKTEPVSFYIEVEPAISFNEYIDEYTLLSDILYRMAKFMQKDYPDLYIVFTGDRLSVFLMEPKKKGKKV